MKEIPLTKGLVAIVDDEDFDLVMQFKWWATPAGKKFKAVTDGNLSNGRRKVYMHRLILGIAGHIEVDHRNRNPLDNRRQNLRPATRSQNNRNQGSRRTSSVQFKGVTAESKSTYRARVTMNGKRISLGTFQSPEDAARAYDEKARDLHGEFAYQNFPQELTV